MLPRTVRNSVLALSWCALISAGGCRSHSSPWDSIDDQDRSMREVHGRVADLRRGMTERQVLLVMGEPASRDDGIWTWVDIPPTALQPARTLEVFFENGLLHDWDIAAVDARD